MPIYPTFHPPSYTSGYTGPVKTRTDKLLGKSHANRLREHQIWVGKEVMEWMGHIVKRHVVCEDVVHVLQNGEVGNINNNK